MKWYKENLHHYTSGMSELFREKQRGYIPAPSGDVRVVKELVLRSNGAIRVGSNPTPRISANSSVVEFNSSKVETWVRFPLGASEFVGTL